MNNPAVLIYGASSSTLDAAYYKAAHELGALCAQNGFDVINGAGRAGMMGATIEGADQAGGHTIGIIPRFMAERGWAHPGLSEVIVTETMHERKKTMADMASAVVALPGGVGTLDELMEIITWRQLGIFPGPVVILNTLGYYNKLLEFLADAEAKGFMRAGQPAKLFSVANTPKQAIECLTAHI